ncbi:MAG: COQ9 family protein, partial [Hyphomonadaceae bacterium]
MSGPQTPTERFRAQLLEAFPAKAAELGWTEAALRAAAEEAGLSEGQGMMAAPRGVIDLADAFAARADETMLA